MFCNQPGAQKGLLGAQRHDQTYDRYHLHHYIYRHLTNRFHLKFVLIRQLYDNESNRNVRMENGTEGLNL